MHKSNVVDVDSGDDVDKNVDEINIEIEQMNDTP